MIVIGILLGALYCALGFVFSIIFKRLFDNWDDYATAVTVVFWPFVVLLVMCGLILRAIKEITNIL